MATAVEINISAVCEAVVVTALHERARAWWLRLGFAPIGGDGLDLYLLTADIRRAFS